MEGRFSPEEAEREKPKLSEKAQELLLYFQESIDKVANAGELIQKKKRGEDVSGDREYMKEVMEEFYQKLDDLFGLNEEEKGENMKRIKRILFLRGESPESYVSLAGGEGDRLVFKDRVFVHTDELRNAELGEGIHQEGRGDTIQIEDSNRKIRFMKSEGGDLLSAKFKNVFGAPFVDLLYGYNHEDQQES